MSEDADFFGAPPAATDFAAPPADDAFAAPPPADDAFAAPPPTDDAFAAPPADAPIILGGDEPEQAPYLGEVNEAPVLLDDAAPPIVLGGPPPEEEPEVPVEPAEPSAMQKWNAEWQETLKTRKDEENARKAELVEAARADLENFQAERERKREAKMAKNREDEQAKLEAIEADLENDNSWQRVCKMVELSHDSTQMAEDVKRMRDVLILLKNDATKAVALA